MSTSRFISFQFFLMDLFFVLKISVGVSMNLEILRLPSTTPKIPANGIISFSWSIYRWKKWKKPVDSSDCLVLCEQFWFTRLYEGIYTSEQVQPRHRFRVPKQHVLCLKKLTNIFQSRNMLLKIKTPSSCFIFSVISLNVFLFKLPGWFWRSSHTF